MSIRRDMVSNGIAWARSHTMPVVAERAQDLPVYGRAMPIYALGDQVPVIHPTAYVHPDAVVIGSVTIGAESSVWPGAVLRGDEGTITIGARSNVQDNCVLHTT